MLMSVVWLDLRFASRQSSAADRTRVHVMALVVTAPWFA